MRAVVSCLIGILSLVATAVALPGLWFERNVVSESGFVELAGPLGDDPEFREALADTVADGVIARAGLDGVAGRVAEPVVHSVADSMTDLPGFSAAWTQANVLTHRINVTDIPPAELDGRLGVDLTPMVDLVVGTVNDRLGTQLSAPGDLVVAVGTPEQRDRLDRVREWSSWSLPLLVIGVALAVVSILIARRRLTALAWLGGGLIAVAVAEAVVVITGGDWLVGEVASRTGYGQALAERLHDAALASFGTWLIAVGVAGALAVIVGLVARIRA
ncbi:hypothetical protein FE697_004365 [Mumia zhuanghuii]|uniref:Integral membrane protein n=2 Tax=Mumia TaxID=1546255 RepID=A0ABW1QR79_9ACTN|nr:MULTISPECIES: hypothetical protein [Mumia]KAA1425117.1 hypothetical protein FE697_004365 [Mumia zhuanghuii]